jgi:hypothetical protein
MAVIALAVEGLRNSSFPAQVEWSLTFRGLASRQARQDSRCLAEFAFLAKNAVGSGPERLKIKNPESPAMVRAREAWCQDGHWC